MKSSEKSLWAIVIALFFIILVFGDFYLIFVSLKEGKIPFLSPAKLSLQKLTPRSKKISSMVLSQLEKQFQFCQVVKEVNHSSEKSSFWLICNGRPFYTDYQNGQLVTDLNGWGFLRYQPSILKELRENQCRFYQVETGQTLSFLCLKGEKTKKFAFSPSNFQLTKVSEELFLNELFKNLWCDQVAPCDLTSTMKVNLSNESLLELSLTCGLHPTKVFYNFSKNYFSLPVVDNPNLDNQEKVRQSVALLNLPFCTLESLQETGSNYYTVDLTCSPTDRLLVTYDLNLNLAQFLFPKSDFSSLFPKVAPLFLPFLSENPPQYLAVHQNKTSQYLYYAVGSQTIVAQSEKDSQLISEVYLKDESLE